MLGQITGLELVIGAGSWIGVGTLIICMIKYFPSQKFCDTQHLHNDQEHMGIKQWIEKNEESAEKRHKEYREDMKELKDLIRKNGNSK